jgi:hypothetical protein
MEMKEAADLVGAIADSLQTNPSQFHFNVNVNVTGFSAQNSSGVGFLAQNSGGIGFNSSLGNTQINIAQQQANAALDQKFSQLIGLLREIEKTLREKTPNMGKLKSLSDAVFAEKWVPGVITVLITGILKALGL